MLSFDITDRQLKIVKGAHSGGKIRISHSCILDVPEGYITNGNIDNVQGLATLINDTLRDKKMGDKEAVVSLSSNQIVFKELNIPKAKSEQFLTMVQNQMQHSMGIADNYSISYSIVGEVEEEKSNALKVLATACPFSLVDSYRKLFNMLSIQLRAVNVSCNCITRIVLSDHKNKDRMPLLVVQIDDKFLSLNLYEKGQLAFSRFITIDKEDYDGEDYLMEALNENVFRMIQFNKSRGGKGISDVIFYGDVRDYIRLTNNLDQMEIKTHILEVPNQITGFENFEFTLFANAIGAMFKRQKETERINLLEVDSSTGRQGGASAFVKTLAILFAINVIVLAAIVFAISAQNTKIIEDTQEIQTYIDSPAVNEKQRKIVLQEAMLGKIKLYNIGALNANNALATKAPLIREVFDAIDKCAVGNADVIDSLIYSTGMINITVSTIDQNFPANFVEKLVNLDYFANVEYAGYSGYDNAIVYSLVLNLKAGVIE